MTTRISDADLILNSDGSIYHLNLLPEDVSDTIITVGDPERVSEVSKYFDSIEIKKGKREFITHTGYLGNKRITVISTGIGTDNIDIVLNEIDALVNIDFLTRSVKEELTILKIIRIGTSGSIQKDIPMGTILASSFGLGLDALMRYYNQNSTLKELEILEAFKKHSLEISDLNPYLTKADEELMATVGKDLTTGITVTAPGFYAPQGRKVRAVNSISNLIPMLNSFQYGDVRLTNLEMETAGIYSLSRVFGHQALSINAILASRVNFEFSKDSSNVIEQAIKLVLGRLVSV
ncbi:nucleoside phosphorylase [Pedobacter sp. JCM 36344]|uniref:nucleoside phosphorylase n=1 Tax=Pedobacter sp. JCM 36344 TaxID=3374280 RepID=UPI00397914CE